MQVEWTFSFYFLPLCPARGNGNFDFRVFQKRFTLVTFELAVVAEICPHYLSWDWAEVNWHIINCAHNLIISNKAKEWPVALHIFIIYHFVVLFEFNADFGFWMLWKALYLILSYDTIALVLSWKKLFMWVLNFSDLKTLRDVTFILWMLYFKPSSCSSALFFVWEKIPILIKNLCCNNNPVYQSF